VLCKALLHNNAITAIGQVATTIAGFIFAVAGVLAVACFSIRLDVIFSFLFKKCVLYFSHLLHYLCVQFDLFL